MMTLNIFSTPIKIKPIVLINLLGLWLLTSLIGNYRHPDRNLISGFVIGFFVMILVLIADFGHTLAHILSARAAKAPMDEILISAGMPRTIYLKNDISPGAHRTRALGGPIFNSIGLIFSAVLYWIGSQSPILQELSGWSIIGHGLILVGSLLPLPVVDGGSILKWSLVVRGKSEEEADQIITTINWIIGAVSIISGIGFLLTLSWVMGLVLVCVGGFFITAGLGILK